MINKNITQTFLSCLAGCMILLNACSSSELIDEIESTQTFIAASYNIRFAGQEDELSGNGWNIRKTPVSNVILNYNMDIVGTQEGSKQQLLDLKALLGNFEYHAHPYGGNSGTIHNVAIFYKPSLFELQESGVFWLSPTPDIPSFGWDATDRRICQWVKFKHKPSGKSFYYFNAHFFYLGITAKQGSGPLIVSKIKSIAGNNPVLLGGDMNSGSATYQMKVIKELLRDSYESENNTYQGIQETAFPGGTFKGVPQSRIDYLYTSNHLTVMDYQVGTYVYKDINNEDTYPSDHLPVICKLRIN